MCKCQAVFDVIDRVHASYPCDWQRTGITLARLNAPRKTTARVYVPAKSCNSVHARPAESVILRKKRITPGAKIPPVTQQIARLDRRTNDLPDSDRFYAHETD